MKYIIGLVIVAVIYVTALAFCKAAGKEDK